MAYFGSNHGILNRTGFISGLIFLGWLILLALLSTHFGLDSDWDLKNYHLYVPFMVLNGKLNLDLAPAQRQTYLAPMQDLIFQYIRNLFGSAPYLLNVVLSVPAALAACLATCIAWQVIPRDIPRRRIIGVVAVAFGAIGAASLPTLATTQSEMIPATLMLGGILLLLSNPATMSTAIQKLLPAGLFFGCATGLKLINAPFCVAIVVAVAVALQASGWARLRAVVLLSIGIVVGALVIAGPWWFYLYTKFGNPLFPYYNSLFHSPFYDPVPLTDDRFKPKSLMQALFYPFFWAFSPSQSVSEIKVQDPRFALVLISSVTVLLHGVGALSFPGARLWRYLPQPDRRSVFVVTFVAICYVGWEAMFSIFRYLAPVEMICGLVILVPLIPLLRHGGLPATVLVFCMFAVAGWVTVYPNWGRMPMSEQFVRVDIPTLSPSSTVVLLDDSPLSYIATFEPPSVRFVGANNNLIRPGQTNRLALEIETAIRNPSGPLWGLESLENKASGRSEETLKYYHRVREGCFLVNSNLETQPLRLCSLVPETD
jgi:hypothetical protein